MNGTLHCLGMGTGFFRLGHCARPRIPNRRDTLLYEDEFELTFQVPEEESAPEPLAAPAAKPAVPTDFQQIRQSVLRLFFHQKAFHICQYDR